jgi:hypothetical protein
MDMTLPAPTTNAVSPYLRKKFFDYFNDGCEFWTSEDGSLMSLVIARRKDWAEVLQRNFEHRLNSPIDSSKGKPGFVYQEWAGRDFFDGPGCGQRRGKVWRIADHVTPFHVIQYPLI